MSGRTMTQREALDAIQQCAEDGSLAMVETTARATGEKVTVLIGYRQCEHNGTQGHSMWPLAVMFDEGVSPFDALNPPDKAYVVDPASDDTEGGSLD